MVVKDTPLQTTRPDVPTLKMVVKTTMRNGISENVNNTPGLSQRWVSTSTPILPKGQGRGIQCNEITGEVGSR